MYAGHHVGGDIAFPLKPGEEGLEGADITLHGGW